MKLIKYKIGAFLLTYLLLSSCTTRDDEFSIPKGAVESALIVTNIEENFRTEKITRVNSIIRLLDASASFSPSREWIFPDDNVEIVEGNVNSERLRIRALEEGDLRILLKRGDKEDTDTIIIQGEGKADFAITAADPAAIFSFDREGAGLVVEAGTELTFTATGENGVDIFTWDFDPVTKGKITPVSLLNQPSLDINFGALGTFEFGLFAKSSSAFSETYFPPRVPVPNTEPKEFTRPLYNITVVPSSKPLLLKDVLEDVNGNVVLEYSRDLDPATLDDISSFALTIDGAPAAIESVSINPDNATQILIKPMSGNILFTQTATIEYTATNLKSVDFADAPSVPVSNVVLFKKNLIGNGDFENDTLVGTFSGDMELTSERAFSGTNSIKFAGPPGVNQFGRAAPENPTPALDEGADYIYTFYVYLQSPGNQGNIRIYDGFSNNARLFHSLNGGGAVGTGNWVKLTKEFTADASTSTTDIFLRFQVIPGDAITTPMVVFYDNFELFKIE